MILLTGVAISLLGMTIPQATAVLIDDAIPYGSENTLIELGLLLLAVAFGRSCFQICTGDRIYVIKAGRVAQQGSFDELAQQDGVFARLVVPEKLLKARAQGYSRR